MRRTADEAVARAGMVGSRERRHPSLQRAFTRGEGAGLAGRRGFTLRPGGIHDSGPPPRTAETGK
jgi:hypothetical protein